MLHTGKNTPLKQICKLPINNSKPLSSSLTGNGGTSLISPSRHGRYVAMGRIDRSREREEKERERMERRVGRGRERGREERVQKGKGEKGEKEK